MMTGICIDEKEQKASDEGQENFPYGALITQCISIEEQNLVLCK